MAPSCSRLPYFVCWICWLVFTDGPVGEVSKVSFRASHLHGHAAGRANQHHMDDDGFTRGIEQDLDPARTTGDLERLHAMTVDNDEIGLAQRIADAIKGHPSRCGTVVVLFTEAPPEGSTAVRPTVWVTAERT